MKLLNVLLCLFFLLIINFSSFGQNDFNNRALGIRYAVPSSFGLIYKKQVKENKYIRLTAGRFSSNVTRLSSPIGGNNFTNFRTSVAVGGALGFENRQIITDKFSLISGFTLIANGSYLYTEQDSISFHSFAFQPGIGYLIGGQYYINDHLHIDIEMTPMAFFNISVNGRNGTLTSFNTKLNMYGIFINLCYQFEKQDKPKKK